MHIAIISSICNINSCFHEKKSSGIFPSSSACWFVKLRMVMFVYEYEETSKQDLLFFTGATHIINALSYKGHKVKGGMN